MWKCPPSTILVPVDFGDASATALQVAASLAGKLGARLRVLHAETIEAPPYFTRRQLATLERERQAARAQARQYLRDFAMRLGVDPAEATVTEGSAAGAIVEAARASDLVVMGTHGRRGPSRWWMGSVAEHVTHESPAPVLVVRADLGGVAREEVFARPLVVAPEGQPGDAQRVASGLAQAFGGSVTDTTSACQADAARERRATVMVVSKDAARGGMFGHPAEQWLRSCTLPMLFVPCTTLDPQP